MLRFYAYFKQATLGPCTSNRPPFWDVVGRAKYDAWKGLGEMTKEDAMRYYVDELHRIVETMSYTEKVANFMEMPSGELESVNFADLELIAGDVMEKMRSQSNSPLVSREASPQRIIHSMGTTPSTSPSIEDDSDHTDEEYRDTMELLEPKKPLANGIIYPESLTNGVSSYKDHKSRTRTVQSLQPNNTDISKEVANAVQSLKTDIDRLSNKINILENNAKTSSIMVKKKQWWFPVVSPQILVFLVVWPFIASLIVHRVLVKK